MKTRKSSSGQSSRDWSTQLLPATWLGLGVGLGLGLGLWLGLGLGLGLPLP